MKVFYRKMAMTVFAMLLSVSASLAQLAWTPYQGSVPANAVAGGTENGQTLYICRVEQGGSKHPGKLLGTQCNYGYGGQEVVSSTFEVLINEGGVTLSWAIPMVGGMKVPANTVQGGTENGKPLLVGQFTRPDGSTHPGKILRGDDRKVFLNYGYGGSEETVKAGFKVLVASLVGN